MKIISIKAGLSVAGWLALSVSALRAEHLDVSLLTTPKAGEKVVALIDADGDVGIESDLAQGAFTSKGSGPRQVDLGQGKVARLGFQRVRFVRGNRQASWLIPILSDAAIVPASKSADGPRAEEQFLLAKFFDSLKQHRTAYLATWPARKVAVDNIVKISTTGTLLLVCAAEPTKLTCVAAGASAGDVVAEAVFDFLQHAIDEMGKDHSLSEKEVANMRLVLTALKASKIALSVALGTGVGEKVVEGLDVITLAMDKDSTIRLTIGLQKDSAGKALKIIHVLSK